MTDEVDFPRGGKKHTNDETENRKKSHRDIDNIFSFSQNVKRKAKKKKADNKNDEENVALSADIAENLSFKTAEEGMLVLGCVRSVNAYVVEVDLPGKVSGKIKINRISNVYTDLLQTVIQENSAEDSDVATLPSLFEIGQFVPTKILEKEDVDGLSKLHLSMSPFDVNSDLRHTGFDKGAFVWAAVQSELDHGYQLDAGIANLRIFLPHKNVRDNCVLKLGQPLWCSVLKSEVTSAVCTVTVSILEEHMKNSVRNENLTLHNLTPGTKVDFSITNEVKNGFEGTFLNEYVGYINKEYLCGSEAHKSGDVVKAWLMYIQPTTKLSYLSMKGLEKVNPPKYSIGKILKVKIVSKVGAALLASHENEKFFIPFKRFVSNLPKSDKLKEAIDSKYSKGSTHKCRIISFQYMDQSYIASFEPEVIKEKYFTKADAKMGELVEVTVKSIGKIGVFVKLGALDALIQNNHLSDVAYSPNIKKQFSVGQKLKARVWSTHEHGVDLTLKPSLVNSDLCVTSYDESYAGRQFPSVVTNVTANGLNVMFYGGVSGFLFSNYLGLEYVHNYQKLYYVGQVIKVYVRTVTNGKLYLSIDKPKMLHYRSVKVGEYVEGIVSNIKDDGLDVQVGINKIDGFIPTSHISGSLSLASNLKDTYKVGDILKELLCISNKPLIILSIMEAKLYKNSDFNIPKIENLKEGDVVRCYYKTSYKTGVEVFTICGKTLKLAYKEMVLQDEISFLEFQPYQVIVTKITKLDKSNRKLHVTAKITEVFDGDHNYSLNLLEEYVSDVERLRNHFQQIGSPLGSLKIGQRVKCVINQISGNGCSVFLENNAQGLVSRNHCPKGLKNGHTANGVILWINYKHKFAEVSLLDDVVARVNKTQNGVVKKQMGSTCRAQVLISQAEYILVLLDNNMAKQQLLLLPSYIHENAFINKVSYPELIEIFVIISRKVGDKLIGIDKAMRKAMKKHKKRQNIEELQGTAKKMCLENVEVKIEEEEEETKSDENMCLENEEVKLEEEETNPTTKESLENEEVTMEEEEDEEDDR